VVQPLIPLLRDDNPTVRREVAEVLGRLGDSSVVQPLIDLLKDEDSDVRRETLRILGQLGSVEAVYPLMTLLENSDPLSRYEEILIPNILTLLGVSIPLPLQEVERRKQQELLQKEERRKRQELSQEEERRKRQKLYENFTGKITTDVPLGMRVTQTPLGDRLDPDYRRFPTLQLQETLATPTTLRLPPPAPPKLGGEEEVMPPPVQGEKNIVVAPPYQGGVGVVENSLRLPFYPATTRNVSNSNYAPFTTPSPS